MIGLGIKLLSIILVAIIQIYFLPNFKFFGGSLNIALIVVMYWVLKENFQNAFLKVVILGFFIDLLAFYPIGFNVISLVLVAFAIDSFAKRFLVSHDIWRFGSILILIASSTLMSELVIYFLTEMLSRFNRTVFEMVADFFDHRLILSVIFNLIFFLLFYSPLKKIDQFIDLYNRKKIIAK